MAKKNGVAKSEAQLYADGSTYQITSTLSKDKKVKYDGVPRIMKPKVSVSLPGGICSIIVPQLVDQKIIDTYGPTAKEIGMQDIRVNFAKEMTKELGGFYNAEADVEVEEEIEEDEEEKVEEKPKSNDAFDKLNEEAEEETEEEVETRLEEENLENTHIGTLRKMALDAGFEVEKTATKQELIDLLETKN